MTLGSLFTGIGGFDLGMEKAGIKTIWQCEIDPSCRKLLAAKWPEARIYEDVRSVNSINTVRPDILAGGFPCQDLSVAGKRAGLDGGRSGLWFEFHRIIVELGPPAVVVENVPGLLSSNGGLDFAVVIGGLTGIIPAVPSGGWGDAGFFKGDFYSVAYRVLDSQFFGVAQRRDRVFIVGCLGESGLRKACQILALAEGLSGHPAPSRETGQRVAATLESRTLGGGFPGMDGACDGHVVAEPVNCRPYADRGPDSNLVIAGTLGASGAGLNRPAGNCNETDFLIAHAVTADMQRLDPSAEPLVAFDTTQMTSKANRSNPKEGDPCHPLASGAHAPAIAVRTAQTSANGHGVRDDSAHTLDGANGQAVVHTVGLASDVLHALDLAQPITNRNGDPGVVAFAQNQLGELRTNEVCGTLNQNSNATGRNAPLVQTGYVVRRLTPTECERLQGFPDGWTEGFSDSTRYRMLGNAVTVPVAEWIGKNLMAVLG